MTEIPFRQSCKLQQHLHILCPEESQHSTTRFITSQLIKILVFQNYFTLYTQHLICIAIKWLLKISPHLRQVATLPC